MRDLDAGTAGRRHEPSPVAGPRPDFRGPCPDRCGGRRHSGNLCPQPPGQRGLPGSSDPPQHGRSPLRLCRSKDKGERRLPPRAVARWRASGRGGSNRPRLRRALGDGGRRGAYGRWPLRPPLPGDGNGSRGRQRRPNRDRVHPAAPTGAGSDKAEKTPSFGVPAPAHRLPPSRDRAGASVPGCSACATSLKALGHGA